MLISVDGYFEGVDHDISWHHVDGEFNEFAIQQLAEIGTLLFGHRTYDLMASYWPTAQGVGDSGGVAKAMNEMPKVIVSHQAFKADWNNTTVVSENVISAIGELKRHPGKDIAIFGSNNLCVSLMEAGLMDEFRIMVNPVALGKGSSLFTGLSKKSELTFIKSREFKNGNILHYFAPKS